jgi:hypothetical protein
VDYRGDVTIVVLSLVVGGLGVLAGIAGTLLTYIMTGRQLQSAQRIADKGLLGPMRQSWINDLRKRLAELLSASLHYYVAGFEDRTDAEYKRLTGVEQEVVLMMNPHEPNHRELLHVIRGMIAALNQGLDGPFPNLHQEMTERAQSVLKAEWEKLKAGPETR